MTIDEQLIKESVAVLCIMFSIWMLLLSITLIGIIVSIERLGDILKRRGRR